MAACVHRLPLPCSSDSAEPKNISGARKIRPHTWPKLWSTHRRWKNHMFCRWVVRDGSWWSRWCVFFTPKQMEQAWTAAIVWALGCHKCVLFCGRHHCIRLSAKLESTVVALESSTSILRGCCNVSAKMTTLACFRVPRDTAMLLSVALAMWVPRFTATLRVYRISATLFRLF